MVWLQADNSGAGPPVLQANKSSDTVDVSSSEYDASSEGKSD